MTETDEFNKVSGTTIKPNTSDDTSDNENDIGESTKKTQTTKYINNNDINQHANNNANVITNSAIDNFDDNKYINCSRCHMKSINDDEHRSTDFGYNRLNIRYKQCVRRGTKRT